MTDDLERRLPFERMLSDLLAIIHRDGGHRQDEVGCEQAWMEAMMMVPPMLDAADEIARLRAENEALREALRPFAREARWISDAPDVMNKSWANTGLSYGDWHRAAAALATPAEAVRARTALQEGSRYDR